MHRIATYICVVAGVVSGAPGIAVAQAPPSLDHPGLRRYVGEVEERLAAGQSTNANGLKRCDNEHRSSSGPLTAPDPHRAPHPCHGRSS